MQNPEDREILARYVQLVPIDRVIIEIGPAIYGSAIWMARNCRCKILTIGPSCSQDEAGWTHLKASGKEHQIERIFSKSQDYSYDRDEKVGLVFIDGDHSEEAVTSDWERYSPLVERGGYILFHDHKPSYPYIRALVDSIDETAEYEVLERTDRMAVVRKI